MKKLSKLKLTHLTNDELNEREMTDLLGGGNCSCGCHYENDGGSSFCDNGQANIAGGYKSIGGGTSCDGYGNESLLFSFWTGC